MPYNMSNNMELCEELYRYWQSKQRDGHPPGRRDIDPILDIPLIVANLVLLDVLSDGYRFRVIGTMNVEVWGVEMTGKRVGESGRPLSELLVPTYDRVVKEQKPRLIVSRKNTGAAGAKFLLIVLPLVDASGRTEQLLCGAFYEGDFLPGGVLQNLIAEEMQD